MSSSVTTNIAFAGTSTGDKLIDASQLRINALECHSEALTRDWHEALKRMLPGYAIPTEICDWKSNYQNLTNFFNIAASVRLR